MLESKIEAKLARATRLRGGIPLKLNLIGRRGWPDRLLLFPGARVLFVEVKRPGEKPRPLQSRVHDALRKLGFPVEILDDPGQIEEMLTSFLRR